MRWKTARFLLAIIPLAVVAFVGIFCLIAMELLMAFIQIRRPLPGHFLIMFVEGIGWMTSASKRE